MDDCRGFLYDETEVVACVVTYLDESVAWLTSLDFELPVYYGDF